MRAGIFCRTFLIIMAVGRVFAQGSFIKSVSGDIHFQLGPSGMPVYPRGGGPNEHWEAGTRINLDSNRFRFSFGPSVVGAATFDNPDKFNFYAGISAKLPRHYVIESIVDDAYALNAVPRVDPKSRRATSSVNVWWLGIAKEFKTNNIEGGVFARYGLRGDEPVIFSFFTKPYAKWHLGADSGFRVSKSIQVSFAPSWLIGEKVSYSRFMFKTGLERRLNNGLAFGAYYTMYRNLGGRPALANYFPSNYYNVKKIADRLFFGVKLYFKAKAD